MRLFNTFPLGDPSLQNVRMTLPVLGGSALNSVSPNLSGMNLGSGTPVAPQPHLMKEENKPGNVRLARNRRTARLRREKKKQEAEILTAKLKEAQVLRLELLRKFNNLPEPIRKTFKSFEEKGFTDSFVSGCLFCDRVFEYKRSNDENSVVESDLMQHYVSEHSHDLKTSQSYLGESLNSLVSKPLALRDHLDVLSLENSQKSQSVHVAAARDSALRGSFESSISSSMATINSLGGNNPNPLRKLSCEEKRRRRLERNAESARLCRQRKKLYIQKLRLDLPQSNFKNRLMADFLSRQDVASMDDSTQKVAPKIQSSKRESSENLTIKSESNSKKYEIPPLNGWDRSFRNCKRNLSATNLQHLETQSSPIILKRSRSKPEEKEEYNPSFSYTGLPSFDQLSFPELLQAQQQAMVALKKTLDNLALCNQLNPLLNHSTSVTPTSTQGLVTNNYTSTPSTPQKASVNPPVADKDVFDAACVLTSLAN